MVPGSGERLLRNPRLLFFSQHERDLSRPNFTDTSLSVLLGTPSSSSMWSSSPNTQSVRHSLCSSLTP